MRIETPTRILATLPTHLELNTDPLLGETGYRVQTDVTVGQTTVACRDPMQHWNGKECIY